MDQTSQALLFPRVWRGARASGRAPPRGPGDRPHPLSDAPGTPSAPLVLPQAQEAGTIPSPGIVFSFCWFQAFRLVKMVNTPAALPPDTHAHRHSRTSARASAAVSGAGPALHKHRGPGRAGSVPPCPAPAPSRPFPPPRRRCPAAGRRGAGGTPAPGAFGEAASRLFGSRGRRQEPRLGQPPARPASADQVEGPSAAPSPTDPRAPRLEPGGAARRGTGAAPACPVAALPVSPLLF